MAFRAAQAFVLTCVFLSCSAAVHGEEPADIRELKLKDWKPRSMLVTPETKVDKPMFPVIDVHNHLGGGKADLTPDHVAKYLTEMDAAGVRSVVNLDGGWGARLKETLAALDEAHPGRFFTFALVDFAGVDNNDWGDREAKRLEESFKAGAKGLKFHKSLGLTIRYKNGKLVPVDDPKLDAVWEMCAKYKRPVMLHSGDPAAFFTPLDQNNERWHELNAHPDWLFYGEKFPSQEEVLKQFTNVVAKHPRTTFIGAHFGNNAEDIATVGKWLDAYPNLYIDIDARISELGRQPYSTRKFLIKYQDRILFGTDTRPNREAFRIYYRFLETDDEYFDCSASHHLQGFWPIYGVFLPKETLEKIYNKNAEKIIYGIADANAAAATLKGTGVISEKAGTPSDEPAKVTPPTMHVRHTADFELTGDGRGPAWRDTQWTPLQRRNDKLDYVSRVKMLYSDTGLYVLMIGTDKRLSSTLDADFAKLWEQDVFEFFFWPDESQPVYFEYEISPLGAELPILIPNFDGRFLGWRPWQYEGARKTRNAVSISGGKAEPGAAIEGWGAEIFVPYALLEPLGNVPPKPGARWRANFYRVDYDGGASTGWHWAKVGPSFHEFKKFGTLIFD